MIRGPSPFVPEAKLSLVQGEESVVAPPGLKVLEVQSVTPRSTGSTDVGAAEGGDFTSVSDASGSDVGSGEELSTTEEQVAQEIGKWGTSEERGWRLLELLATWDLSEAALRGIFGFLQEVKHILMRCTACTATTAYIGSQMPEHFRKFLKDRRVHMCHLLGAFGGTFEVTGAGHCRVRQVRLLDVDAAQKTWKPIEQSVSTRVVHSGIEVHRGVVVGRW
mmetsp:Transcript_26334/g.68073  ORF Transcript_26334/g.68073 Transcript_26334/m.68073 type:complete len:220 (-) Transcript_26334:19-678(-)